MQRVSNLEKEDYSTSEIEIFDAAEQFLGRTSNLMKILITHTPEIARWWLGFLVSIRQDGLGSNSDVKLRGLACVKTSMTNECNYCTSHTRIYAKGIGLSDEQIITISTDEYKTSSLFTTREKLALEWAEAVTLNQSRDNQELASRMKVEFSDREIFEITLASGLFNLGNRLNDSFVSELESETYNRKQWDAVGKLSLDALEDFASNFPGQKFRNNNKTSK